MLRRLLLVLFLLLAQAGALAHGYTHAPDQTPGDEPVCEQCLAYAPMGAGAASTPPTWPPPAQGLIFDAVAPTPPDTGFRPSYRSRAPPRA